MRQDEMEDDQMYVDLSEINSGLQKSGFRCAFVVNTKTHRMSTHFLSSAHGRSTGVNRRLDSSSNNPAARVKLNTNTSFSNLPTRLDSMKTNNDSSLQLRSAPPSLELASLVQPWRS